MNKRETYLFYKFIEVERKKIEIDKWIEGQNMHCDPGEQYINDWVRRNAENWRNEWNNSKCKTCLFWMNCGYNLKCECDNYDKDANEENLK